MVRTSSAHNQDTAQPRVPAIQAPLLIAALVATPLLSGCASSSDLLNGLDTSVLDPSGLATSIFDTSTSGTGVDAPATAQAQSAETDALQPPIAEGGRPPAPTQRTALLASTPDQASAAAVQPAASPKPRTETAAVAEAWSVSGSPAATYANIARGLLSCHLRRGLPLAATHMLFAETPPGVDRAEVTVHERTAENRHGLRVYRINLVGFAGQTQVTASNIKFDGPNSEAFRRTAYDWSRGRETCGEL